jgi:hypothetical protein
LTARLTAGGAVEFVDAKGAVALTMPVGYLEDSAIDSTGAGAMSHDVRYELVTVDGAPALKMTIDGAWLRDPKRKFPVVLDPTVGPSGDTYVQSTDGSTTDRSGENNFATGTWNSGGQVARAFINFDNFTTSFAGKRMSAVGLNLFMTYQGNGGSCVARPYEVKLPQSAWGVQAIRWSTQPGLSGAIGTASPSSSAACGNTAGTRNVGVWSPGAAGRQRDERLGDRRRQLRPRDHRAGDRQSGWKRFTSANPNLICNHATYGAIECDPFIDATYTDNVVPQVDTRYPSNNYAVSTLTPELAARGHDPDNWPAKGLRYRFLLYNDQGAQLTTSPWVTDGLWKVPEGHARVGQGLPLRRPDRRLLVHRPDRPGAVRVQHAGAAAARHLVAGAERRQGLRGDRRQLHDVRCRRPGGDRRSGAVDQPGLQQPRRADHERVRARLVVAARHADPRGA